ncbi:unnamed protein product [Clonostachys solani]|uniref:D-isomer specific 2-hydroxyacid dehydrogenase NAD-binding domain-containing protein n=1 Tax=Clonostachys solani TaxID=160281 RepID=A0A9N9ZI76_9HYPO|nr:unnamed protein product [Clonostachys solani]
MPPTGRDPQGKILGILDISGIGCQIACKSRTFQMLFQYAFDGEHKRHAYLSYDSFSFLLKAKMYHLTSHPKLRRMHMSVIVNTTQGAIIDEEGLVAALESGKICGAGPIPNILRMPQMGTLTVETGATMEDALIANVKASLGGNRDPNLVRDQRPVMGRGRIMGQA